MGEDSNTKTANINNTLPFVEDVSYDYFFENFLQPNLPCVIKNVTANWEATKFWTQNNNQPCFEYLRNRYGNSKITAYKCNEKYFNSQQTCDMKFEEYLDYWTGFIQKEYSKDLPLYYLKDWHLKNEVKDDSFYQVPIYFESDWLNEYLTNCDKDDYRFVYMGPKGSWTPFHQDVFSSYSWSANICGKKKWILFPPGQEKKLLDKLGNLPYDIQKIPTNIDYIEVIQYPGQAIFVPSGWHHQVWNLENTISINHNWINGCNIKHMWKELERNLFCVQKEISDCRDMVDYSEQCQLILKATFGMDFKDFFSFLHFIAQKRLKELLQVYEGNVSSSTSKKYVIFDLNSLRDVLVLFQDHYDLNPSLYLSEIHKEAGQILEQIIRKLDDDV